MRGICVKSLFFVSLSAVLARNPEDPSEYSYTVDCSMAQYDYVDAGRPLNATYSAQTRSECITNCQSACGSNPLTNLDCLKKSDNMAGCSFFVQQTMFSGAKFYCNPPIALNGISLQMASGDFRQTLPIPIYFSITIPGYDSADPIYGITESMSEATQCAGDFVNAEIPVVCSNENGQQECDVTDVIAQYKGYPLLVMNDVDETDFFVTVVPSADTVRCVTINTTSPYTYAKFISAGMVHAISNSCTTHDNCNDCAAAKCNWCNNKDQAATKSGYKGCGVSLEECEDMGYPFNNCDAYPKSGVMRTTGVISLAGLTLMAVLGFSM